MANDNPADDPNAYPAEWGYKPRKNGAVAAAFDVYAASLSDEEFAAMVDRTRTGR
jgi:hypothetical protein